MCSCSSTRAASRLGGVPCSTGTTACSRIGPTSRTSRHAMHGAARKLAARIDGTLMGVQTGEGRQQRGMDVDQPVLIVRNKARRENTHETGQHHQIGRMAVDDLRQARHQRPRGCRTACDPAPRWRCRCPARTPDLGHRPCCSPRHLRGRCTALPSSAAGMHAQWQPCSSRRPR